MGRVTASEGVCAVKETSDCERQSGRPDETEAQTCHMRRNANYILCVYA